MAFRTSRGRHSVVILCEQNINDKTLQNECSACHFCATQNKDKNKHSPGNTH